jgi:hypothetical protein
MGWFNWGKWQIALPRDDKGILPFGKLKRQIFEAICVDRAGQPSPLPEKRPRRRDFEPRRNGR